MKNFDTRNTHSIYFFTLREIILGDIFISRDEMCETRENSLLNLPFLSWKYNVTLDLTRRTKDICFHFRRAKYIAILLRALAQFRPCFREI